MFFFAGPVLLILSLIFNWILGNFMEMMTAGLFAVFWLSFGVLELPSWGLIASYSKTGNVAEGAASVEFNAGIGLFGIAWGFILLTFFFFSLKRTVVSAAIFGFAAIGVFVLDASYWEIAAGNRDTAHRLAQVSERAPGFHFCCQKLILVCVSRSQEGLFCLSQDWVGTYCLPLCVPRWGWPIFPKATFPGSGHSQSLIWRGLSLPNKSKFFLSQSSLASPWSIGWVDNSYCPLTYCPPMYSYCRKQGESQRETSIHTKHGQSES